MIRSTRRGGTVRGAVFVVVLALTALSGAAHAVAPGEMKARESFAAGRYDEALEAFAKLYAETLNPIYLRNIGRCHQKLREPQKAIDAFHDYLAKGKKIGPDERSEIDGYIKEMEALRDEQAKAAAPPVQPIQPIAAPQPNPPPPSYAAPPPSYAPPPAGYAAAPPQGTLIAQPGQAPPSESSPFYTRWWFWTAVGVVVAGGVVAALLLSSGTTKPGCPTGVTCQ
jgi:hypothetical protein